MPAFPQFGGHGYDGAAEAGYIVRLLSRHSHFLNEEEFVAVPFLFYREAKEKGLLSDFLELEGRFLAFFDEIGERGVRRITSPNHDRPMHPGSSRTRRYFQRGLREVGQFDVFFPHHRARFVAGHDMEFLVFLTDPDTVPELEDAAARAGLFLLGWE